jgi:hypothetical protein
VEKITITYKTMPNKNGNVDEKNLKICFSFEQETGTSPNQITLRENHNVHWLMRIFQLGYRYTIIEGKAHVCSSSI